MKEVDIFEIEQGSHCFGPILKINGVDYEDVPVDDLKELINDMLTNNYNKESLLQVIVLECLGYLQSEQIEYDSHKCDQCGDYNWYSKSKIEHD